MQHTLTLADGDIRVRPLEPGKDAPALRALADEEIWAGMSAPLPGDDSAMAAHLEAMSDRAGLMAFAVERAGRIVGRTTFYDLVPEVRAEIGNTFYAREQWGTDLNPTVKLLMFEHAFTELGLGRVALRCDSRNTRSHDAILRLGAHFEGTLRRFRPAADGTIADVDYFSILLEEWPHVRAGLRERLRR